MSEEERSHQSFGDAHPSRDPHITANGSLSEGSASSSSSRSSSPHARGNSQSPREGDFNRPSRSKNVPVDSYEVESFLHSRSKKSGKKGRNDKEEGKPKRKQAEKHRSESHRKARQPYTPHPSSDSEALAKTQSTLLEDVDFLLKDLPGKSSELVRDRGKFQIKEDLGHLGKLYRHGRGIPPTGVNRRSTIGERTMEMRDDSRSPTKPRASSDVEVHCTPVHNGLRESLSDVTSSLSSSKRKKSRSKRRGGVVGRIRYVTDVYARRERRVSKYNDASGASKLSRMRRPSDVDLTLLSGVRPLNSSEYELVTPSRSDEAESSFESLLKEGEEDKDSDKSDKAAAPPSSSSAGRNDDQQRTEERDNRDANLLRFDSAEASGPRRSLAEPIPSRRMYVAEGDDTLSAMKGRKGLRATSRRIAPFHPRYRPLGQTMNVNQLNALKAFDLKPRSSEGDNSAHLSVPAEIRHSSTLYNVSTPSVIETAFPATVQQSQKLSSPSSSSNGSKREGSEREQLSTTAPPQHYILSSQQEHDGFASRTPHLREINPMFAASTPYFRPEDVTFSDPRSSEGMGLLPVVRPRFSFIQDNSDGSSNSLEEFLEETVAGKRKAPTETSTINASRFGNKGKNAAEARRFSKIVSPFALNKLKKATPQINVETSAAVSAKGDMERRRLVSMDDDAGRRTNNLLMLQLDAFEEVSVRERWEEFYARYKKEQNVKTVETQTILDDDHDDNERYDGNEDEIAKNETRKKRKKKKKKVKTEPPPLLGVEERAVSIQPHEEKRTVMAKMKGPYGMGWISTMEMPAVNEQSADKTKELFHQTSIRRSDPLLAHDDDSGDDDNDDDDESVKAEISSASGEEIPSTNHSLPFGSSLVAAEQQSVPLLQESKQPPTPPRLKEAGGRNRAKDTSQNRRASMLPHPNRPHHIQQHAFASNNRRKPASSVPPGLMAASPSFQSSIIRQAQCRWNNRFQAILYEWKNIAVDAGDEHTDDASVVSSSGALSSSSTAQQHYRKPSISGGSVVPPSSSSIKSMQQPSQKRPHSSLKLSSMSSGSQGSNREGGIDAKFDKKMLEIYAKLHELASDFAFTAEMFGKIIISEFGLPDEEKTISPLQHTQGIIGGEKFVVHGILFKFAIANQVIKDDEIAAKIAGHELKSLESLMNCDLDELCFPLMSIIDYKGHRLVAMSFLPIDGHKTLKAGSGNSGVSIAEPKGALKEKLSGDDGRFYLVDFSRLMPPDIREGNDQYSAFYRLFRPEFVRRAAQPLCSDTYFTDGIAGLTHQNAVEENHHFLVKKIIPEFAYTLSQRDVKSLSMTELIQAIHRQGVNLRYLGVIRSYLRHTAWNNLLLVEMISRVTKWRIRKVMRIASNRKHSFLSDLPYKRMIAKELNLLLNYHTSESRQYWSETLPRELQKRFPHSTEFDVSSDRIVRKLVAIMRDERHHEECIAREIEMERKEEERKRVKEDVKWEKGKKDKEEEVMQTNAMKEANPEASATATVPHCGSFANTIAEDDDSFLDRSSSQVITNTPHHFSSSPSAATPTTTTTKTATTNQSSTLTAPSSSPVICPVLNNMQYSNATAMSPTRQVPRRCSAVRWDSARERVLSGRVNNLFRKKKPTCEEIDFTAAEYWGLRLFHLFTNQELHTDNRSREDDVDNWSAPSRAHSNEKEPECSALSPSTTTSTTATTIVSKIERKPSPVISSSYSPLVVQSSVAQGNDSFQVGTTGHKHTLASTVALNGRDLHRDRVRGREEESTRHVGTLKREVSRRPCSQTAPPIPSAFDTIAPQWDIVRTSLRDPKKLYQRALEIAKRPQEEVIRDLKEEIPVDQKRRILTDAQHHTSTDIRSLSSFSNRDAQHRENAGGEMLSSSSFFGRHNDGNNASSSNSNSVCNSAVEDENEENGISSPEEDQRCDSTSSFSSVTVETGATDERDQRIVPVCRSKTHFDVQTPEVNELEDGEEDDHDGASGGRREGGGGGGGNSTVPSSLSSSSLCNSSSSSSLLVDLFSRIEALSGIVLTSTAKTHFSTHSAFSVSGLMTLKRVFDITHIAAIQPQTKNLNLLQFSEGMVLKSRAELSVDDNYREHLLQMSVSSFERSLACNPFNHMTLRECANVYSLLGKNIRARIYYELALDSNPEDKETMMSYAVCLLQSRHRLTAEDYLVKTFYQSDGNDMEALAALAEHSYNMKRFQMCEKILQYVIHAVKNKKVELSSSKAISQLFYLRAKYAFEQKNDIRASTQSLRCLLLPQLHPPLLILRRSAAFALDPLCDAQLCDRLREKSLRFQDLLDEMGE